MQTGIYFGAYLAPRIGSWTLLGTAILSDNRTASVKISVALIGNRAVDRKVVGTVNISKTLSNTYYGIQGNESASIELDNRDQELNFMISEEIRGKPMRIIRYDEISGESQVIFDGSIIQRDIGETVQIEAEAVDYSVFDVEMPKNKILGATTIDEFPNDSATSLDLTTQFPESTDVYQAPPLVFGKAEHSQLLYVKYDRVHGRYDYIVCEGRAEVEEVYWLKGDGWTPKFRTRGYAQGGTANSITLSEDDTAGDGYTNEGDEFYVNMVVRILNGPAMEQERRIIAYDRETKTAEIEGLWDEEGVAQPEGTIRDGLQRIVQYGSYYEIRTYMTLPTETYFGRTAIRFFKEQKQDGSLQQLTAKVQRLYDPGKNYLVYSNQFEINSPDYFLEDTWEPPNGTGATAVDREVFVEDPFGKQEARRVTLMSNQISQLTHRSQPVEAGSFTFSIWLKTNGVNRQYRLWILTDSVDVTVTDTWQRFSVSTITGGPTYLSVAVGNYFNPIEGEYLYMYGAQLEKGDTMTWYEPTGKSTQLGAVPRGMVLSRTFPQAIQEVLSNTVWGLGLSIDSESFTEADNTLGDLYLRCDGCLPTAEGTTYTAKELLDNFLQMRGMRLMRRGSAWSLYVDSYRTELSGKFGSGETEESNIIEMPKVSGKSSKESTKKIEVKYGLSLSPTSNTAKYKYRFKSDVYPFGVTEEVKLDFVQDHQTADRWMQYHIGRLRAEDNTIELRVGSGGRNLLPGDLIQLNVPKFQAENLIAYSERYTDWIFNDVGVSTITEIDAKYALDPFAKKWSTLHFKASWDPIDSAQVKIPVSDETPYGKYYLTFWARSPSGQTVGLNLGTMNWQGFIPSSAWNEYSFVFDGDENNQNGINPYYPYLVFSFQQVAYYGDAIFEIAKPQICRSYPRKYVATHGQPIHAQDVWEVYSVDHSGDLQETVQAIPYSSSIYDYTANEIPTIEPDFPTADYRTTPPPTVTGLTVPLTTSAATGLIRIAGEAFQAWADISFVTPTSNATLVEVQRSLYNEQEPDIPSPWETIGNVSIGLVGFGHQTKIRATGFVPGIKYWIRCISYNSMGLSTISLEQPVYTAPTGSGAASW